MIKAVLFDMDGLLIDSEPMWRKGEMMVFKPLGINLTDDDCRRTTGMRVDEVVRYWDTIYPEAKLNIEKTTADINRVVGSLVEQFGEALPGVKKSISLLKNKNIPLAIASASTYDLINKVINRLNLAGIFTVIQSAEFMTYGKPHPEVFLETAKKLNVKPDECLVLEDSVYGVLAGKAAKMKVIAVPDTYNFEKTGYCIADKKLKTLEEFDENIWQAMQNI